MLLRGLLMPRGLLMLWAMLHCCFHCRKLSLLLLLDMLMMWGLLLLWDRRMPRCGMLLHLWGWLLLWGLLLVLLLWDILLPILWDMLLPLW